jgi:hypothetical protein
VSGGRQFEVDRVGISGAAALSPTLEALDVAAVFLEGVHGPLFAGSATARLGDSTRLLLGLGRFLDFFLASLALGALQVVDRLLVFEPLTFGSFSSGNSLGFGFCFGLGASG